MRLLVLELLVVVLALTAVGRCGALSLYEYYAPGEVVTSGLTIDGPNFLLNGKNISIYSGSFHYFRVHPSYCRDTLKKIRAAGLNTVQIYVPWNLHEPRQREFDFGDLGEDMSPFLDVRSFLEMAQEEDLFVTVRPGPYICAEWDFGGLPSWLLRDPTMAVRSYYEPYRLAAEGFLKRLLLELVDLQFEDGGPVIAMQIENEFGSFGYSTEPRDRLYMEFLKSVVEENGFSQTLLFTSDNPTYHYDLGALPDVLQTANFNSDVAGNLVMLDRLQPGKPKMVAEFWSGWFDYWSAEHHSIWWVEEFALLYESILLRDASVNLYMFIGGTNFGFHAGANEANEFPTYRPLVTSYDYDAPLTEAGDYTEKYWTVQEILSRYNPLQGIVDNPEPPVQRNKSDYGTVDVTGTINFWTMVDHVSDVFLSPDGPVSMEELPMNNMNGQSFGYTLYTATVAVAGPHSTIRLRGHVRDLAQVMFDGALITQPYGNGTDFDSFGFWEGWDQTATVPGDGSSQRLDILVENLGRVNFAAPHVFKQQKKGLWEGPVLMDDERVQEWTITPLEFKQDFIKGMSGWAPYFGTLLQPSLYRATFTIVGEPEDTFLDMTAWNKGVVFLNGVNLGRYWSVGPTRTLYAPAPFMVTGQNEVVVFEQYKAADVIKFSSEPILG